MLNDYEKYTQMYANVEGSLYKLLKCDYLYEYTVAVILPLLANMDDDELCESRETNEAL